ncbi:MAG TPA: PAS domain-containing protein, partial [Opitutaceae bacterium]
MKAADASPILIAVFQSPNFGLVYLNQTGREWLNSNNAELESLDLNDLIGVASIERVQNVILPHAQVLGKWIGDCELRDIWGSEFRVKASFFLHTPKDANRRGLLCLQAVKDQGKESDGASLGDRELLRALLDTLPECVYFKDTQSRMLRVSQAMAVKMGFPKASDLIGHTDFDFFSIVHAQPAYDDEQRVIQTGKPIIDVEEKEIWPDGRIAWASTTKMPLFDRAGHIVGTYGISRDITAKKEAERQQRELESQLQLAQKLESVGRLAAGIAHEINTPTQFITDNTRFLITSLKQITDVIAAYRAFVSHAKSEQNLAGPLATLHSAEENAEIDYLIQEIPRTLDQSLEGLGRVARIVRSLKEFSHPSSNRISSTDLNHAIETAINVCRHEWKYVADVVTEFEPGLPPVSCVLDEFNQVMLNLLINAAHAIGTAQKARNSSQKGTITVRTSHDAQYAIISVSDTGTGIPDEY